MFTSIVHLLLLGETLIILNKLLSLRPIIFFIVLVLLLVHILRKI